MKKFTIFGSMFFALFVAAIAVAVVVVPKSTTQAAVMMPDNPMITRVVTTDDPAKIREVLGIPKGMVLAAPLRIDFDSSSALDEGYERVSIHNKTEEKAKAFWLFHKGTLEGYSLEKANQATFVAKKGTVPCACHLSGACYRYYPTPKGSPPNCEDECQGVDPNTCFNSVAGGPCKTVEELNKILSTAEAE